MSALALLCVALAPPAGASPVGPAPASGEALPEAQSLALVEMKTSLDALDELRRGAFNREHFSNVIRHAVLNAVPHLKLMAPEAVAERLRSAAIEPDNTSPADAPRVGRALGVDLLVTAQVLMLDDRLRLDFHLFDVRDGRMVGAGQASGLTQTEVEVDVPRAIQKALQLVPRPDVTRNRVVGFTAAALAVAAASAAIIGRAQASDARGKLDAQAPPFDLAARHDLIQRGESMQRVEVAGAVAFAALAVVSALFLTWSF